MKEPAVPEAARGIRIGLLTTPVATVRNLEHLIFRVAEILSGSFEVELVGLQEGSNRIEREFPVFRYSGAVRRWVGLFALPWRIALLTAFIRERRPDVLMTLSGIGVNGLAVAIAGRLFGIPSIVRVTSDIFEVQRYKRPVLARLRLFVKNNLLGRIAIRLATRVIVLHEVQIRGLARRGEEGRFSAIPQPIEFPSNEKDREGTRRELRERFGIPLHLHLIGYFGRVSQDKNVELLARVLSQALSDDDSSGALIVGSGPETDYLKRCLNRKKAWFSPQVPRDALADFYRAIDVLLHTSFSEGLSTVMAESLYFGVPVAATDSGPITRALISNIASTEAELTQMVLNRSLPLDELPGFFDSKAYSARYQELILETVSRRG